MKKICVVWLLFCWYHKYIPIYEVPKEVEKYINFFENRTHKKIESFIYLNGNMLDSSVGECQRYPFGDKVIYFNRNYFDFMDDNAKEEVTLHELGHCELKYNHDNDLLENKCPKSIMYYEEFGSTECYKNNKTYYYNEFFNK